METPILNQHNKLEHEPSHTCEHVLNATMVKMFGCPRSRNAHVEKKKSKCDYILSAEPTPEQVLAIEAKVNEELEYEDMKTMRSLNQEKRFYNMSLEQLEKFVFARQLR